MASLVTAHCGIVTLTAQYNNGTNNVAELSIGLFEVAEVVSFPQSINSGSYLYITKDGKTVVYFPPEWNRTITGSLDPLIVAGPATLRLTAASSGSQALCTVRVSQEPFPPDRTILLPPGTNQARLTLESSTNPLQWFSTTNGVYSPLPEPNFFRIKLEPLQ